MTEHLIKVERTARFYTLGKLDENTTSIWFVIHGYGQLSQYFIKKFAQIVDDKTFIVAPEAISRFYLDEKYSRIGASWMTRELRQSEIDENNVYLNSIYDNLLKDKNLSAVEINLLGFSQGCATVCRWIDNGHVKCKRLLLWAGFFNNGIRDIIDPDKLKDIETYYVYGEKDEYFIAYPEMINKFKADMIAEINPEIISFDGGHTVHEETLKQIVNNF